MKPRPSFLVITSALFFSVSLAGGQERPDPSALVGKIANWPAPAYWSREAQPVSVSGRDGGLRREGVEATPRSPMPFIGITPCRIADTRGNGFTGPYGPPALVAGVPRTFILKGRCGIADNPQAVSLNVTVTNTLGPGFILIFPDGEAQPGVSTLNYVAGQTVANAAVVPLGTSGGITVIAGVSGTDLILDTNGYYGASGVGTSNTFLGLDAGNFTMTGDSNTGIGSSALQSNTTGGSNTAVGQAALTHNTEGNANTATGGNALLNNTTGTFNTGTGVTALASNTEGSDNTATGAATLSNNTAGASNTAVGSFALAFGATGDNNTAVGASALWNNTGNDNIALGALAGGNLTTGSHNICIGNDCVAGQSGTIRIGTGFQSATFISGISGATSSGGVGVFVNASGQLGTLTSTFRAKEDIRGIAGESDALMRLRPVAFRYKPQIDPSGLPQYGLIAEEVAEVYPDLVVYDRDGRPETVRYHLVNALLLNEVQKQHRTADAQKKTIEQQKAEIEALEARVSKLEARLLADSRP